MNPIQSTRSIHPIFSLDSIFAVVSIKPIHTWSDWITTDWIKLVWNKRERGKDDDCGNNGWSQRKRSFIPTWIMVGEVTMTISELRVSIHTKEEKVVRPTVMQWASE